VPRAGRLLALDVGDRRVGVAVTDPLRLIATPLDVVERRTDDDALAAIVRLAREAQAVAVVVGLPLLPSGDRGEQAVKVEAFAAVLADRLGLPLGYWDESYTTLEAASRRRSRSAPGRRQRSDPLDAEAAAVILEEWLAAHRQGERNEPGGPGGPDEPDEPDEPDPGFGG
jgi:putative Holliday junction resolvase